MPRRPPSSRNAPSRNAGRGPRGGCASPPARREFEALLGQMATANEQAAGALDRMLRENFADQEGRLPRTLERFLGDPGGLRTFVGDLFDETRRDSAIGRMQTLLGRYFDGDASRLALLLHPTRLGSPRNHVREEGG